ncbi:NRAMP family divalent metal transporter [Acidithrix ferrooxidans]|uniref:Divalent metal cation transporter MntH n=1 Tax=Acidithrix ferrooxidans TaxID=1280514 RepID=A0A0D8HMR3_9ACTN|nr:NRAMP family divalent metal transporter [Acidithrix ferrooxidans]KJF18361.1 divalent metal cation transporter MntH [Acidithrix ferrooxidans]
MIKIATTEALEGTAVLDDAHLGDIQGALGTIALGDVAPRRNLSAKLKTLLAIVGPGLIVMVGDNDAGAFGTYTQAGQNYGTHLLWTLLLLVPVLYVSQEMVLRLGAVSGVGHARLILERFGKFWGAFSVIDLFILNALTIVTEFIGVTLATGYLGLPKVPSVILAGAVVVGAASTGSFRRFERVCLILVAGSLVLIPIYLMVHPPVGQMVHNFVIPGFPHGAQVSTVMLLIIGIVGTTVAPWQLFFQQSYVIDKRITPRFINYERADLWIGIGLVVIGAAAMFGFSSAVFAGHPEFGNFTNAAGVSAGLAKYVSPLAGDLFAIALLDASIIGAAAVGLATAYASSDVLGFNHSLHRPVSKAKGFYLSYAGLIALSAALVIIPGVPLGLLTEGVQTLAGVLLPSAVVFLMLLCNDKEVLGPWVNGRKLNILTSAIIWVLVLLSIILTASVLFPSITTMQIVAVMGGGVAVGLVLGLYVLVQSRRTTIALAVASVEPMDRRTWRMPALATLKTPVMSTQRKIGLLTLRGYLIIAFALVVVKIVEVAVR